tara:strand:- start:608 stop:763 length:156 start_codon:yes stop_codon:yes gene_type:complete
MVKQIDINMKAVSLIDELIKFDYRFNVYSKELAKQLEKTRTDLVIQIAKES